MLEGKIKLNDSIKTATELLPMGNIPAYLTQLENEVHQGLEEGTRGFLKAAAAIKKIQDSKLYLKCAQTWSQYCDERIGKSRSYVYRQLKALAVAQSMGLLEEGQMLPMGNITERQLRELKDVTPDEAKQILKTNPTAKAIKQQKAKMKDEPGRPPETPMPVPQTNPPDQQQSSAQQAGIAATAASMTWSEFDTLYYDVCERLNHSKDLAALHQVAQILNGLGY